MLALNANVVVALLDSIAKQVIERAYKWQWMLGVYIYIYIGVIKSVSLTLDSQIRTFFNY